MEDSEKSKKAAPPYVAYRTLRNFLDKFKQFLPARIDRDSMGTMSGAAQSQVLTALKYLGFISENGIPSDVMKRFVKAEGADRQHILQDALKNAYPFVFANGFDISAASMPHLREEFESNTTATGETITRCITFLKDAATDAGFQVSPLLKQRKPRGTGPRAKRANSNKQEDEPEGKGTPNPEDVRQMVSLGAAKAQDSLLLWGLFQRLPAPGTVWPESDRKQWIDTLQNVFTLEYKNS